jgi:hypothetical protein
MSRPNSSLLSVLLPLTALLTTSGCGPSSSGCDPSSSDCGPSSPGLERFDGLLVQVDDEIDENGLPQVVAIYAGFTRPQGEEPDCRPASSAIVATLNGRPMDPVEGVQEPSSSPAENPNCFAPAFRLVISREEALQDGGRVTVVVEEEGERVRLVSDRLLGWHGPERLGSPSWYVPRGSGTFIPWVPAEDDLSELKGDSLRNEVGMEPRAGGLWVMGYSGQYTNRVLSVSGKVSVAVSTCEGIERCSARIPVRHYIDLNVY